VIKSRRFLPLDCHIGAMYLAEKHHKKLSKKVIKLKKVFKNILCFAFIVSAAAVLNIWPLLITPFSSECKAASASELLKAACRGFSKTMVTIGTGDPRGLYYFCGKRIEKVINLTNKKYTVIGRSSNGAFDNISFVADNTFDFGFSQLDMLLRARAGMGEFNGVKHDELVVVTVLFPEVFTIVGNDKIKRIEDFKNKSISTHLPGSGVFQNSTRFLEIAELADSVKRVGLNMGDTQKHFCDGHIDGFFSVIGMPAAVINNSIAKTEGAKIIGLSDELKNKVSDSIRGFVPYEIPPQTYANEKPVPTIATFAVIFTTDKVCGDTVKTFLNTIYSLPDFSTAAGTKHGKVQYISKENAAKLLGGVKDLKIHDAAAEFFNIKQVNKQKTK